MKSNQQTQPKSFRVRMMINVIYSLVITCLIEVFLVGNLARVAVYLAEAQSQRGVMLSIASIETIVVLLFVLLGIGIFVLVFWLLTRSSFRYIRQLTDAVRSISSGDLDTRLEIEEDNEFSEIAMNLNTMAGDIRVLMDKERESERSKNELITNVAHDLRTPLTSIIGYLELLSLKKDLPEETRAQYISIAYTKARKLEALIEDLFGFTKLNYGKIAMKVERVDIVKLLSQLMDEFYPNFAEKELQYDLTSNVPSAVISADGTLLARLFDNLINNAIKYGADGKRIDVKIRALPPSRPETVTVSVINYGKVIPAEELPLIFEKFYRTEKSRSSQTGGTGLGLAIAKNIVDMHGGSINVESDLKGTRFIVTLKADFDVNREQFENAQA